MGNLTRLCRVDEVSTDAPLGVDLPGLPPLAVYRFEGRIYVTGNVCTHGHALLSEGYQEGALIECPFHAGAFDIRTGAAVRFPCEEPIPSYPVTVEEGWVLIPA